MQQFLVDGVGLDGLVLAADDLGDDLPLLSEVTPLDGGSGKRTRSDLGPSTARTRSASRRAIRRSMLCAIAAFVAFAPNRSTTRCIRAISRSFCAAVRARRRSSSALAATYCE